MQAYSLKQSELLKMLKSALEQLSELIKKSTPDDIAEDKVDDHNVIIAKYKIIFEMIRQTINLSSKPISADFSLFLSWSFNKTEISDRIYDVVKRIGDNHQLEIKTGRMGGGDTSLIGNIRKQIEAADMLLCVMTPEKPGEKVEPNAWLLAEVAMAAAFEKPFTIIVHENIDEEYWKNITGEYYHLICTPNQRFEDELEKLVEKSIKHLFDALIQERINTLEGY